MSEGRRLTPVYQPTQPHPSGPALPYAYEKSEMDRRAATSTRIQHALSSPTAGAEHSDVLNLHQFVNSRASEDTSAAANIGMRMAQGEKLRDAVKSTSAVQQQARTEAMALRGYLRQ